MGMTPFIKAIFCEDVRMEMSGQATLVGVFPGVIILTPDEDTLQIAQWIEIHGLSQGDHNISITAYFVSGEDKRIGSLKVDANASGADSPTILTPRGLTFTSDENGYLVVRAAIDGGPPVEAGRIRVQVITEAELEDEDDEEASS